MHSYAKHHVLVGLFLVISTAGCSRSPSTEPDGDIPLYADEFGEEIFGPDYRPVSPIDVGTPLEIGTPNAGIRVPADLRKRLHESFAPKTEESGKADGLSRGSRETRLPFRREFGSAGKAVSPLAKMRQHTRSKRHSIGSRNVASEARTTSAAITLPQMFVHYVFVGQGDGAIVEFPCGVAVIDTGGEFGGGQRANGAQLFVDYLTEFFEERPELSNTIDVLFTTHPHADHLNGLPLLTPEDGEEPIFDIRNVVDNGQTAPSGSMGKQTRFREKFRALGAGYSAVELARQITATGATNSVIDPFDCGAVDPIITVFWGGINDELPDDQATSTSEYSTPNNHSLVIRIDYGEASFLFTGDLEDRGERDLRTQFQSNIDVFDVDIYQVSHHGADDDTSDEFLEIMSPNIAIVSMGDPTLQARNTAFDHGHPRTGLLSVLQDEPAVIADFRDPAEEFLAAAAQDVVQQPTLIERAIFGTGWEGTVIVGASTTGEYEIFVLDPE